MKRCCCFTNKFLLKQYLKQTMNFNCKPLILAINVLFSGSQGK
jgi:hypothetical protein